MSVRLACVLTLQKILEDKVFFSTLKDSFKPQDRAFANFLILMALRRKTVIDQMLNTLLFKKIPNKNRILNYVLLLGSVELLYAKTPDYAVINEYVTIAKKLTDLFSSRMVNAVLRKAALKREQMQSIAAFPENFRKILKPDYTEEQIRKMESMLCCEPPLDISVKENPSFWANTLNAALFENGTIRLYNPQTSINLLCGYENGAWWVQDLAASLPVCFIQDLSGKKVLDLCAAPGGKTAQLLSRGAFVTAVDISNERLQTLKENMARLSLEANLSVVCADGIEYLKQTNKTFDIILLDAPCSATGTFRKHPEVLHFKTVDDVKKQLTVQQALLCQAAAHIKPNGFLFYATCSLSKAEGEEQAEAFLIRHPDFALWPLSETMLQKYEAKKLDENMIDKQVLRTLPYHNKNEGGADGFFCAAFKRISKGE